MVTTARLIIVSLLFSGSCLGQSALAVTMPTYAQRAASVVAGTKQLPWKRFGVHVAVNTVLSVAMVKLFQRANANFNKAFNGASAYIDKVQNKPVADDTRLDKIAKVLEFIMSNSDTTTDPLFADQNIKFQERVTVALRDMALLATLACSSGYLPKLIDRKFFPDQVQPAIAWKHYFTRKLTYLPLVINFLATQSAQPNTAFAGSTSVGTASASVRKQLGNAAKLVGLLAAVLYINERMVDPYFLGNQRQPLRGSRLGIQFAQMALPSVIASAFA